MRSCRPVLCIFQFNWEFTIMSVVLFLYYSSIPEFQSRKKYTRQIYGMPFIYVFGFCIDDKCSKRDAIRKTNTFFTLDNNIHNQALKLQQKIYHVKKFYSEIKTITITFHGTVTKNNIVGWFFQLPLANALCLSAPCMFICVHAYLHCDHSWTLENLWKHTFVHHLNTSWP